MENGRKKTADEWEWSWFLWNDIAYDDENPLKKRRTTTNNSDKVISVYKFLRCHVFSRVNEHP